MVGYINNSIYNNQGQYAQNFGMANPQQSQQFAGFPAQTFEDPTAEPGLMESVFNPLNLIFAPLTLNDPNVKKYVKNSALAEGVEITRNQQKKIFGFKYKPEFKNVDKVASKEVFSFGNLWKESVVNPRNAELYKSLAKEGKTAQQIADIAHGIGKGTQAQIDAITAATKGVKTGGQTMNSIRSAMGTGSVSKFFRSTPILSTALFSIGEIGEISAATKFGTAETVKQVGRSAVSVAGDVTSFEVGTAAGAKFGAQLGSKVKPGMGTLIGGAIGGLVGGLAASHVTRKVINFVYDGIFGKQKHKEAAKQEAIAAQQEQAMQQQAAYAQSQPQQQQQAYAPQFQGMMPGMTGNISLGDEYMLNNMNSAYNMYQFAA